MSLAAFQTALADLTASPALVRSVRAGTLLLETRYALTGREAARLAAIAGSRGMEANCMLYRANRLAPVALNCPETCTALGDDLGPLISAFWADQPTTDVNFLVETDRFCRYLWAHATMTAAVQETLRREHGLVVARLAETQRLAGRSAFAAVA